MTKYPNFLDPTPQSAAAEADFLLLPLPYEGTVSYGTGTSGAPHAIWVASTHLDNHDDEVDYDLFTARYHSAPEVAHASGEAPESYLARVTEAARKLWRSGPGLPFSFGGEHGVTPALVRALDARGVDVSKLTVVQFDAHADLRDDFEGTPHSHACAMRRVLDQGASVIAIGIRSAERDETLWGRGCPRLTTFWAHQLANDPGAGGRLMETLGGLTGDVYLTVDIDALEPYLCPGSGTPLPGGMRYWEALRFMKRLVLENKKVRLVGCDLTEAGPTPGTSINEIVAVNLAVKVMAYYMKRNEI